MVSFSLSRLLGLLPSYIKPAPTKPDLHQFHQSPFTDIQTGNSNHNMNNRSNRKSVFLCFRPIQVEEEERLGDQYCFEGHHHHHPHQVLAYNKIGEKQQGWSDQESKSKPRRMKAWLQRGARRRSAQRIISKIAKAVSFKTKLGKRIRSRKVREDLSRQVELAASSNPDLTDEEYPLSSQLSFSITSTSLTSSSSLIRSLSSSTTSNSCVLPTESKHNTRNQTYITKYYGWQLLLVSLVSVILFGRFLAVLWTTAWLFLVTSRHASCANEDNRTVAKTSNADDQSLLSRDHMSRAVSSNGGFLGKDQPPSRFLNFDDYR